MRQISGSRLAAASPADDAREVEAEAIEKQRDSIRSQADIEAERLEQEAEAVRKVSDGGAEAAISPKWGWKVRPAVRNRP